MVLAHIHYKTDLFPDYLNIGYWKPQNKEESNN